MRKALFIALLLPLLAGSCSQESDDEKGMKPRALPGYALPDYALTDDTICRAVFTTYMNRKAVLLGMHHTHFADASGLVADGSVITAHDAVLLALKAQSLPTIALVWGQRRHAMRVGGADARTDTIGSLDKAVFTERHRLLGCKTGTLAGQAGVVLICEGAGGQRYVAAVLGSVREQRWRDARRLIDQDQGTVLRSHRPSPSEGMRRCPLYLLLVFPIIAYSKRVLQKSKVIAHSYREDTLCAIANFCI